MGIHKLRKRVASFSVSIPQHVVINSLWNGDWEQGYLHNYNSWLVIKLLYMFF